jgi:choline dehydrogenase-like flavoprotein
MLKHERLEPIDDKITERTTMPFVGQHHGTSGPVRTSFNDTPVLPIETAVIKAADEATGFSKKPLDPWSGDHIGFYNTLGAVARSGPNKGKRSYAGRGFYQANEHRPNLKVITESNVARILLDDDKAATGVEFISGGQRYTVKAKREVIISGGTIASPQMLELSGIGDPEVLCKAGIECLVPLSSVGNDLQDHVCSIVGVELTPGEDNISSDSIYKPEMMEWAQKLLAEHQGGPLTSISSTQGFFPAKLFLDDDEMDELIKSLEDTKFPQTTDFHRAQIKQVIEHYKSDKSANLQFVLVPATVNAKVGVQDQAQLFPPPSDPSKPNGITLAICLQYPASRGYIHIKSSDPFEHPDINPNYIQHEADVIVLAAGVRFCNELLKASAVKGRIGKRYFPSSEFDLETRQGRRDAVRDFVFVSLAPLRPEAPIAFHANASLHPSS